MILTYTPTELVATCILLHVTWCVHAFIYIYL